MTSSTLESRIKAGSSYGSENSRSERSELDKASMFIPICKRLQKRHELVFLLGGQSEATDRFIYILWYFWGGPTGRLLSRVALRTARKAIARVVEVDDFLQALKVAVVHIGLDEIGARPLVDISQCGHLELAVESRSQLRPICIRAKLPICKKGADSFNYVCRT